jgi:hypothetical protein
VVTGAAAGAIAGFLIGGVGGRSRCCSCVTSSTSSSARCRTTDSDRHRLDRTFQLLLGGGAGAMTACCTPRCARRSPRLRLPLWSLFTAAFGGATIVREDGVDFTLLEAAWPSCFVALPAAAAALVMVLVRRWARSGRGLTRASTGLCARRSAAPSLVFAALVGLVAF